MQNQYKNWDCYERQPLMSVTTSASSPVQFTTKAGQNATDARIINIGNYAMNVRFGNAGIAAVNTANSAGIAEYYLAAGQDIVVGKDEAQYFSAITDSGTSSLVVEAGQGN